MTKKFSLFPLIIILLLSACQEDLDMMPSTPIIDIFNLGVVPVNSSVDGQILDTDKLPIVNAMVQLGDLSTLTNKYGLFSFDNVTMNEVGTFISVTKNGYFDGSRRFFPREGIKSKVVIEMIAENFQPIFEASTGGTVVINGTTIVTFSPNSIANANGEVFEGEVFATYTYLADLEEEVALQSFGMINLNLQDVDGAPLNILDGNTATISLTIPTSIATDAPNEIPLWSFNEEVGIWVEEGLATKVNGQYVGEVSHFSWWNCDAPFPLIELDFTLVDENENPLSDHIVAIGLVNNDLATNFSYTNTIGFTSGKVPANLILLLQIRGLCEDIIYSTTIGPFTEDTSIGNITIEDPGINNTQISGSIVDCNGNQISNGGVMVEIGDVSYLSEVDNGTFDFFISTCNGVTDLTIKGFDFDALLESDPIVGAVGTIVNTGPIQVCDNPVTESFLTITIEDETYNYVGNDWTSEINTDPEGIIVDYVPSGFSLFFWAFGTTPGNYNDLNLCFVRDNLNEIPFEIVDLDNQGDGVSFENFTISQINPSIVGTFSGIALNIIDTIPDTVFVSGSFTIIP